MVHRVQVDGGIAAIGSICHPASARFHPGAPQVNGAKFADPVNRYIEGLHT